MKKTFLFIFLLVFLFFFVGPSFPKEVAWGVNFSQKHAKDIGLDWKKTYSSLLQDLEVKRLKVAVHWDIIEPAKDQFVFKDIDWQVEQAENTGAKLMVAIGMKTPRWPECHIPSWAQGLSKEQQQQEILEMIEVIVTRYRDSSALGVWQVENEPLVPFGICPWIDKEFLGKEVALVRSLDPNHSVLVSDRGELSLWFGAAKQGDILGTTLYRKVWTPILKSYFVYPLPPVFYTRKAQLVRWLYGKETIGVELQAEPWGPKKLIDTSLQEQAKTMNPERFRSIVEYARKVGFAEQYFWGAEWWYWMKEVQNDPAMWNEAKKIFSGSDFSL